MALERGWAEGGFRGAGRLEAELMERRSESQHVGAYGVARMYDDAGHPEKAILWLEEAYDARAPNLPYVAVFPFSAELRSDPRFLGLLRKMDLPLVAVAGD